jgi:Restriction endonuclease fold toxin 9
MRGAVAAGWDTDPVTLDRRRDSSLRSLAGLLLAAVLAVLAVLLPATAASAGPRPAAENSVGAIHSQTILVVGVHHAITAGRHRVRGPSQLQVVSAHCVAAEDEAPVLSGPGPGGGESTAAAYGRAAHAAYDYGPGFEKEFVLENGQRADAVNLETREVVELKPNNPRAIRLGTRQAQGYADQLNQEYPGEPFTYSVQTYDAP